MQFRISSESEENSECIFELALDQNESQKLLTTLQESTKNFLTGYLTVIQRLFEFFLVETYENSEDFGNFEAISMQLYGCFEL